MRVLVVGSTGCIGAAAAQALRMRGHVVVAGARGLEDGERSLHVDFMQPRAPESWVQRLQAARIDVVVNCVGILIASRMQTFARIHAHGPIELFRGAALAGVKRIVQVSALGVGGGSVRADVDGARDADINAAVSVPYLATKLAADDALQALAASTGIDHAIVRPSLVYGPGSASGSLFATLASMPVIALPGGGRQAVQPIHVYEVAESIARLVEAPCMARAAEGAVFELAGPEPLAYRDMLATYRRALGFGAAIKLPVPMLLMKLSAWFAEALPQRVLSRDTMRLLERGNTTQTNAAPELLRRAPTGLAEGLRVTPPVPLVDLRVELSAPLEWALRAAVAFMWLYTAAVTALAPQASGVLALLARCGFSGDAGVAVMAASCALNAALGAAMLLRPGPWTYAAQIGAVFGYTTMAAIHMPELALDHCGPLLKNLPLIALLAALSFQRAPRDASDARRGVNASRRATRQAASPPSPRSPSAPASRRTSATPSAT